jgi:hypothetical protein
MRAPQICSFILVSVAAAAGCGGGGEGDGGDDDGTDVDASNGGVDADIPSDYTRLIGRDWSLPPGATDTYRCARFTVPSDMYITNIIAQGPIGTHHTVLSIADSRVDGADGAYDCNVQELGMVMLYASGVGTSPLDFPPDVSVRVSAGTQLHLNLHLYNASDAPITGDSAILVKSQATATPTLAEMVFAGNLNFSIPANTNDHPIVGGCTANSSYSLFAIWPHMHQYAKEQTVELIRGGNTMTLHDRAYSFAEQNYFVQSPIVQVQQGDQIRVTCRYDNPLNVAIPFGDSSDQEMCFAGLYRFPAQGGNIFSCSSFL